MVVPKTTKWSVCVGCSNKQKLCNRFKRNSAKKSGYYNVCSYTIPVRGKYLSDTRAIKYSLTRALKPLQEGIIFFTIAIKKANPSS